MNNIFVVIEHDSDANTAFGKQPRYGFSIKAEPSTIQKIMQLSNQTPSPLGIAFPFGSEKQYLQTWGESADFKDELLRLGLRQLLPTSQAGLNFYTEWVHELAKFVDQQIRKISEGF